MLGYHHDPIQEEAGMAEFAAATAAKIAAVAERAPPAHRTALEVAQANIIADPRLARFAIGNAEESKFTVHMPPPDFVVSLMGMDDPVLQGASFRQQLDFDTVEGLANYPAFPLHPAHEGAHTW